MSKTEFELKPCPFCKGKARLIDAYELGNGSWLSVIEHGCTKNTKKLRGASVRYTAGGRDAVEAINNVVKAWNRRANNDK